MAEEYGDREESCSCNFRGCMCQTRVSYSGQLCSECANDDHYFTEDDDLVPTESDGW